MRIVITELMWPHGLELLRSAGPTEYDETLWQDRERLALLLRDCEALVVRNQTRADAALLAQAPALRVVGRLGVGLDNLDLPTLRSRGVVVVTSGNANSVSVAEYTMAAILALARDLAQAYASTREGGWERLRFTRAEVHSQTLGIVGLGDVGARVAKRASAFGMRLLAHDPALTPTHLAVSEFGVTLMPLDALLAQSDFVTLHVPLIPATRGLISRHRLSLMKPSAFLINSSRGGLVDEGALADALEGGRLAGAALDVRDHEPPGAADRLAALPNVLLTPHIAGLTVQSQDRVCTAVAEDVLRVLGGQTPIFRVA